VVTALANELRRTGKRFGLVSICAAGGIGGVMILENRSGASTPSTA
jgi:acetyl-CoA acyltransferase